MKLFLGCTELGLGHVNRIIPLGKKLQERNHELHFFSGGTAYQLLKKEFENVYPCTPVAWYENAHGVIASASVLNILFPLPYFNYQENRIDIKSSSGAETIQRYYDLRKRIRRIKPDLIISDGDMHALRLAHRWKIPSVYVTNIIRPSYSFSRLLLPGERFTERYVKKCNKIIVPDNPRPYTISEYNLGNIDEMEMRRRIEFVGSFSDMTAQEGPEKHIFAPISGPLGTRAKLISTVIPVLSRLNAKSIVSLGEPQNTAMAKRGNCEIHGWLNREQRDNAMRNAKIVIFSAGHGTCFEVIKHMKPSICVPTQPEQMANAKKLQKLGCAITVENQARLESAIAEIERKSQDYRVNLKRVCQYSAGLKGLDRAVDAIESFSRS
jgi:uncharacterized protein (TIGR00661 family)